MHITKTKIPDVVCFLPSVYRDERGFFYESFRHSWLEEAGVEATFVQDNHSLSKKNTLRGLHFQSSRPQGKLVRVVSGEVYCVAVDLRNSSSTFKCWVGEYLSAENKKIIWVPEGFAHGFYVTSESAEFFYKCTEYYAPELEKTLLWNDPEIGVEWPLQNQAPVLSVKDAQGLPFGHLDVFE